MVLIGLSGLRQEWRWVLSYARFSTRYGMFHMFSRGETLYFRWIHCGVPILRIREWFLHMLNDTELSFDCFVEMLKDHEKGLAEFAKLTHTSLPENNTHKSVECAVFECDYGI